jgi:O-antigen/teichoic acid export membrane protein
MEQGLDKGVSAPDDFGNRVKRAVFWRSGTQIVAQIISWGATLAVIRILEPGDYGLFAMTSVVLVFMNFLNGYGFVSALIQSESIEPRRIRQAFGMLLLINGALALIQLLVAAPLAAAYYREPIIAEMLRWQALIYLSTPFLILPEALMTRDLQFRKPAIINLATAAVGAAVSLIRADCNVLVPGDPSDRLDTFSGDAQFRFPGFGKYVRVRNGFAWGAGLLHHPEPVGHLYSRAPFRHP